MRHVPPRIAPVALLLFTVALGGGVFAGGPLAAQSPTRIVFASAPDDSGTVERLVDAFNEAHRGEIEVTWRAMPRESDAHREALLADLEATPGGIDLMATDVVWTAELAHGGYVADVTDRFYDAFEREAFLPAPLRSATYRLRIRGVPWYTDAGLLFYRRDLLEASGRAAPPGTWDELAEVALRVTAEAGTPHGFVFQGAAYEGGTANAAEFIWSAGGDLTTSRVAVTGLVVNTAVEVDSVAIGSEAAARGLDLARDLVEQGVAPPEVANFREADALAAFAAGEAVFLRSWPYAWGALRQAGFTPDQVGVAPLPAAADGGRRASCLGGWNLMLNDDSSEAERDAAWTLLRYLTDPAQQRRQALEASLLPVLASLYDDPELQAALPVVGVGTEVFAGQLEERPMTPLYSEVSDHVADAFHRVLRGELTGSEATAMLAETLREILARNR